MNKLLKFFEEGNNTKKAAFVGSVAGLCALFMGISQPELTQAREALAVVQLFWLVLLTFSLTSLFFDFVKFVWRHENKMNKTYDLPFNLVLTSTTAVILGGVIFSLWSYMLTLYSKVFAQFTIIWGFPSFVVIVCIIVAIFIKKREKNILLIVQMFADSVIMGLFVMIAGLYLEFSITKLFHTHWFYPIAPLTMLGFFIILIGLALYRKQNLLKPYQEE